MKIYIEIAGNMSKLISVLVMLYRLKIFLKIVLLKTKLFKDTLRPCLSWICCKIIMVAPFGTASYVMYVIILIMPFEFVWELLVRSGNISWAGNSFLLYSSLVVFFTYVFYILIAAPRKKKKISTETVDKVTTSTSSHKEEESMEADVVSMISLYWRILRKYCVPDSGLHEKLWIFISSMSRVCLTGWILVSYFLEL